jgi:hypothetical protein
LSLSFQLTSVQQFNAIRVFNLTELHVAGNPFAVKTDHETSLREFFPSLCKLDELIIKKVATTSMPKHLRHLRAGDLFIDEVVESVVIKTNTVDMNNFKKFKFSEQWHQIVVSFWGGGGEGA